MQNKSTATNNPTGKGKVGRIIFYIFSSALIAILIILLITTILIKQSGEPPTIFGYRLFIITSESMEPAIMTNSMILTKSVDADTLQVGDVITFKDHIDDGKTSIINTHRIVQFNPNESGISFITKGDNNNIEDEPLRHPQDIYGKVIFTSYPLGVFLSFLRSPLGLAICIALPIVVLLVFEIFNLTGIGRRRREEDDDEEDEPDESRMFGTHSPTGSNPVHIEKTVSAGASEGTGDTMQLPFIAPKIDNTMYANLSDNSPEDMPDELASGIPHPKGDDVTGSNGFAYLKSKRITTIGDEATPTARVMDSFSNGNRDLTLLSNTADSEFAGVVQAVGRDRFIVDGIDVRVLPSSVQLGFDQHQKNREISITVTKEYTSVIVEASDYEVNFALFKDENDQEDKVVIKRTPKQN